MNSDRIKEIQCKNTPYPESVSVAQALLAVWNEVQQEHNVTIKSLEKEYKKLIEREKVCPTILESEARALLKALQEIAESVGLDAGNSPRETVEKVKLLVSQDGERERVGFKSATTCNCKSCGLPTKYSERYDSWYCEPCNLWVEGKCSYPDCEFCSDRPDKPAGDGEIQ